MTPFGKMSPFGFMRGWENPFLGPFWRAGKKRRVAPTVTAAWFNGDTLRVHYSGNVTHVSEPTITASGGAVTATYSAKASARVIDYDLSRTVGAEDHTIDLAEGAVTAGGTPIAAVSGFDAISRFNVAHGTAPGGGTQHETMPSPYRNGGIVAEVAGGAWSSTGTWVGGVVPGATSRVFIPAGTTVTLDTTGLLAKGILVAGILTAARDADTAITCTTCVVMSGGELNLGEDGDEIPSGFSHVWTVRNEALESSAIDWFQFGNGIVVLDGGKFYCHGAVKTEYVRLAAEASATDTALTVEAEPDGWEVGDEVVLMSTAAIASRDAWYSPSGKSAGRDPEVRIIDSVVTTTVNVTVGLTDDHPPALNAADGDGWHPHLVNLTHNVKIQSEDEFDAGVTTVGHILVTGTADIKLRYVQTTDLGRTRGGLATVDPGIDDTVYNEATGVLTHYGTNQRGRYPFHFHHCIGPATDPDVTTLTLGGTPDGGTFKLVYMDDDGGPSETAAISWHATGATLAGNIQAALDALHGVNEVVVTGTGPFTLTSAGTVPQPMAVVNDLTGTDSTIDCGYQFQLESCSVRRGGRWAVTVHGSSFGLLRRNVVYDATAAGYSLEDANEWANVIDGNFASYIHNDGVDEPFGPCITANGFWFQNEFQVWEGNIVASCWQNAATQDIDSLVEPYQAHGRHNDRLGRDGQAVSGDRKRPLFRGADIMHGTEGVDYVNNDPFGQAQIVARNDEFYALFAGLSYDHLSDQGGTHHKTTGLRSWRMINGGLFVYGNGSNPDPFTSGAVHQHSNFEIREFVQHANNLNANSGVYLLENGTMSRSSTSPTWGGAPTPFGLVNRGGASARSPIFWVEGCTIHCESPIYLSPPTHNGVNEVGGPPDTFMPGTVIVLKDCTVTQTAGAAPDLVEYADLAFEGAVQCRDPMSIHQVWIDNLNADGRLLRAHRDGALPSATANGPALSDGFACPVNGLTNQQCFDTYGRWTDGEPAPVAGTTTLTGVDAILKEDTDTLAVTDAEVLSSGTRFRVTFNRKVSDTDRLYCLSAAFHSFAGLALDTDAADPISLLYYSGEYTDTVDYITSRHVSDAEGLTRDYTPGTIGIWPIPNVMTLASFTGQAVTNSSALTGGDPSPFTSGAVLHAVLDDVDVWSDDGPNTITITEAGTVTVADGAAVFDGAAANYLSASDAALDTVVGSGVYTILVQVKLTTNTVQQCAFAKYGDSGEVVRIIWDDASRWKFEVTNAAGTAFTAFWQGDADHMPAGVWVTLGLTCDGTTIHGWVDGIKDTDDDAPVGSAEATFSGSHDGTAGTLYLGNSGPRFGGDNVQMMTGSLKNVRIFDYELSDDEMRMQTWDGTMPTWPYPDLPSGGASPLLTDLIYYLELDEASGTRVDAHSTHDFTENGTVGSATGKIGDAASFDNNSSNYLSAAHSAALATGDIDFEWGGWVLLNSKAATQTIYVKGSTGGYEFILTYNQPADAFEVLFFTAAFGDSQSVTANTFGSPSTATWYRIHVWHDAANDIVGISVNDTEDDDPRSAGVASTTDPVWIGRNPFGQPLDGLVDEVGFWKRILTSQERTDLYAAGAGLAYPFS